MLQCRQENVKKQQSPTKRKHIIRQTKVKETVNCAYFTIETETNKEVFERLDR